MNLPFPITTNPWALVGLFFVALLVLHVVLVFWLKVGKRGWKLADYYWLGFTAIGLIGASGQARHLVAKNMEPTAKAHASWEYDRLLYEINFYSADPGVICRTFTPSPLLSEAQHYAVQTQFDAACKWMKDVSRLVPPKDAGGPLDINTWPGRPTVHNETDQFMQTVFRYVADYNESVHSRDDIHQKSETSELEDIVTVVSPMFLALALALRITKVTGELRMG